MKLLNVYRVTFFKREPIYVAAESFSSVIDSVMNDPLTCPEQGDEVTSIGHTVGHCVFVQG